MKESSFVEVVKVMNGVFVDPQPHIERMLRTTLHFFSTPLNAELTDDIIPIHLRFGLVKCRIVYNSKIVSISFEPYKIRNIRSLALVEHNSIDYSYKYLIRDSINKLLLLREDCDDILIVKNSMITDTSYTNIVFKDSKDILYTPTSCLLAGTKRKKLLETGVIHKKEILVDDIHLYEGVYLINTMIDIEDNLFVGVDSIIKRRNSK